MTLAYAVAVIVVAPERLGVWLAFSPILFTFTVSGVYAASLVAERRYLLATMRVPLATAIAVVLAAFLALIWESTLPFALSLSLANVATLLLLVVRTRRVDSAESLAPVTVSTTGLLRRTASASVATIAVGGPVVIVVERILASGLPEGAVALLAYARGFALLPLMLATALASGIFPAATERHRELDHSALRRLVLVSVRLAILTALVSNVFIVICRRELVGLALQRGELGEAAAQTTADLTAILACALVGLAAISVGGKVLFAIGRGRVGAIVGVGGVAAYIVAVIPLRDLWKADGLAAAYAFSSLLAGALVLAYLTHALSLGARCVIAGWLVAPSAHAAAFAAAAFAGWSVAPGATDLGGELLTVVIAFLSGTVALLAAIVLWRGDEYALLRRALNARNRPKRGLRPRSARRPR